MLFYCGVAIIWLSNSGVAKMQKKKDGFSERSACMVQLSGLIRERGSKKDKVCVCRKEEFGKGGGEASKMTETKFSLLLYVLYTGGGGRGIIENV